MVTWKSVNIFKAVKSYSTFIWFWKVGQKGFCRKWLNPDKIFYRKELLPYLWIKLKSKSFYTYRSTTEEIRMFFKPYLLFLGILFFSLWTMFQVRESQNPKWLKVFLQRTKYSMSSSPNFQTTNGLKTQWRTYWMLGY